MEAVYKEIIESIVKQNESNSEEHNEECSKMKVIQTDIMKNTIK